MRLYTAPTGGGINLKLASDGRLDRHRQFMEFQNIQDRKHRLKRFAGSLARIGR